MQPTVSALRAIGVEFTRRAVRPFIVAGAVVVVALLSLGGWLISHNAWWWVLQSVFIIGALILIALVLIVYGVLRKVSPALSKPQKRAVSSFVDKLERVAENIKTPQIIIIYYVVRDTIRPQGGGFIETVSKDSKTLAPDFAALRALFERKAVR